MPALPHSEPPTHSQPNLSPRQVAVEARLGRVLKDKWRLDELIGIGGGAAVYAATHRNGRRAAVKMLHPDVAADPESRARFVREGYLANRVQHPGVVCVLDDDVDEEGSPFVLMELLEGETIETRWQRKGRALNVSEVLAIADQVLDVLAVAHAAGVVHRDIKPANLFLTRTRSVKLLDFGLARSQPPGHDTAGTSPRSLTVGARAMGTPAFMAPEQALGRADLVDARTDLWAVGATMLTLLSGRHVHEANSVSQLLLRAMTRQARPAASVLPGVHAEVAAIIDRALAFHRDDRWQDAREMQRAVRRAYQNAVLSKEDSVSVRLSTRASPTKDNLMGVVRLLIAVLAGVIFGSEAAPEHTHASRNAATTEPVHLPDRVPTHDAQQDSRTDTP